ncbi:putative DNA modification/repair radical SAM protein [Parvularcula dongshanensis]|uniref:Putative DNA modification/repair radical SAM protein n=1 Tax=Parvularcula dongshanensis TaxID=1173995 RepID=A0A840I6C6_9PROT|nr:putative DNA modification/repair radical SAM protein [Parvularcula dongshanensis]MBB4659734.1 putative DNA modification/repair radical SAM protein [Parvularcula dongshanensis]
MPLSSKTVEKLRILADAAKYDASCASSGSTKRNSIGGSGVGSIEGMGICHAYAPDGRCISLLKVLLTNYCMFDCAYCVNRVSSNVERASFTPREVADLTLDFYKRNYIEGLFLSSGIIRSPDHTMEQIVEAARILREEHDFRGYLHLKTIPEADPTLIEAAGRHADRVSINIELPSVRSLEALAPEKSRPGIEGAMAKVRAQIDGAKDEAKSAARAGHKAASKLFAPGGQSTQMIVGADAETDAQVIETAASLYGRHKLRRVYYSAYSPIPDAKAGLPVDAPPLVREHRLYQADWLTRFYGFEASEVASTLKGGMLDLDLDPKTVWALQNRGFFPLDINMADREALLRVPGLGEKGVEKILAARSKGVLRYADLTRLAASVKRVAPFVVTPDWRPGGLLDQESLEMRFKPKPRQADLFGAAA